MKRDNICSIYLLTNTINNKVYIGQTWYPLSTRMGKNGCNYKHCLYLYAAILKYGADKFQHEILIQCRDQKSADYLEEHFINQYDSRNHKVGYNLKAGGSVGKHSEETKAKISISIKNKEWSKEALAAKANSGHLWKGKKREPQSPETIKHHSDAMKEWHANNEHPMKGKHHSDEVKQRIGAVHKGKKLSEEHKAKLNTFPKMDSQREQEIIQAYQSELTIADIEEKLTIGRSSIYRVLKRNNISRERDRKIWSGKQHSEETKQKMAESRRKYWDDKRTQETSQ